MKEILLATIVTLGMMAAGGVALAAQVPAGSGRIYTEALNIMSAKGYHGMNLVSQSGNIVHATAMTQNNKTVSLTIDTATGAVHTG